MSAPTNSNYMPLNNIYGLMEWTTELERIINNYDSNGIDNEVRDLLQELNGLNRLHRVLPAQYRSLRGRISVIQARADQMRLIEARNLDRA